MLKGALVLMDYHLRPHQVDTSPSKIQTTQTSKIESSKVKTGGLKWSSSSTSMLKGAFVLWDYHLRPHHMGHHPFQNPNPQNLKIESSKSKPLGSKMEFIHNFTIERCICFSRITILDPIMPTPSKIQTLKISKLKVPSQNL